MLCDNQNKAETLLQICEKGQTSVLKTIVIMDAFSSELAERGAKCGVDIVSMQDVEVSHVEHSFVSRLRLLLLAPCQELIVVSHV